MKTEHKVITFSLMFGLLFWIFDAVLDYFFFFKGTFPALLITDVPPHELYIRLVVITFFLIFGFIVLRFISRLSVKQKKLTKSNRLYATLSQVNQTIVREKDKQKLFQEICDIAIKFGKFKFAWIGLVDEKAEIVRPAAFSGEGSDYIKNIKISITDDLTGKGPTGRTVREGKSVVFNDLKNNPDYKPWRKQALEKGYRSSASFPIRLNNVVIGALGIYAVEPDFFDKDEIELLEETAMDISFALDNFEKEENRNWMEEEILKLKDSLVIEVAEKTEELNERLSELERFKEATIEREFRIKELNDRIEELEDELKKKG